MEEKYDFFLIGQKHANDELLNIRKTAAEYGQKYGKQAKVDFELGIASVIPSYSNDLDNAVENIDNLSGTNDYGIPNTRNNSYFGGTGTGRQHEFKSLDGIRVAEYIDPEKSQGQTR